MRKILQPLLLLSVVLLVPVIPFALLGWWLEPAIEQFASRLPASPWGGCLVTAILATDIFLPVPSSVVSTIAGRQLGVVTGTVSSWLGMVAGSVLGFSLAKCWGRSLAARFTTAEQLDQMEIWHQRYGIWTLVVTRPLPVLAEAAVLLCGIHRLPWRQFLPPILVCHLALAYAYAALGKFSYEHSWFVPALVLAAGLPLGLAEVVRRGLQ